MSEKQLYNLQINEKFKALIRPLSKDEYLQLEWNIQSDGCRDPIVVWNGVIIDGHNRYGICHKHQIPFAITNITFENEDEATAWICSNQLGRRNISEETRRYLIGKKYEAEKIITFRKNEKGLNQYTNGERAIPAHDDGTGEDEAMMRRRDNSASHRTAERLGEEFHLSHATVEKYGAYSKAIDTLTKKDPALVPHILSGEYRISQENIIDLSKKKPYEIRRFSSRMEKQADQSIPTFRSTRSHLASVQKSDESLSQPSVKDMPKYDPDADVAGLTLTIPSWISSIERTKNKSDLPQVSVNAKADLTSALLQMKDMIEGLLIAIKES